MASSALRVLILLSGQETAQLDHSGRRQWPTVVDDGKQLLSWGVKIQPLLKGLYSGWLCGLFISLHRC